MTVRYDEIRQAKLKLIAENKLYVMGVAILVTHGSRQILYRFWHSRRAKL